MMEVTREGTLRLNLHPGQSRAWRSKRRFILVLAGTQGGKTSFLPHWLHREIQMCGAGDYGFVAPTFTLLEPKALPEFKHLFQSTLKLGQYIGSPNRRFEFSVSAEKRIWGKAQDRPTRVLFGYGNDPDSLASSTFKAVVCDEAGQKKFKYGSWLEILKRVALSRGRILLGTTPYCLGWLKTELFDRYHAGDSAIDLIQFSSLMNPAFSREEFEERRRKMPAWMFDLSYRALFTRPAGIIYGNFDETHHKCKRFPVLPQWKRYMGLDFGGVNTATLFYAEDPRDKKLYVYREYHAGNRTAKQHVDEILKGEPGIPYCIGGSKSEGHWRAEFTQAGLPVYSPDFHEVDVGIQRVWEAHADNQIVVFDDLAGYLDQKLSYSRVTDDAGNVLDEIEDKETYHWMDCERYLIGWIRRGTAEFGPPSPKAKSVIAKAPPGVFASQKMPTNF